MGAISDPLTLDAEALEVGPVSGIGGSMVPLRWRGIGLMRRLSDR
ncbi:hypothetical protein [Mesorhizobium qingshengii]|nr:hypothetical protein [Mesorhizobium qingshengii]